MLGLSQDRQYNSCIWTRQGHSVPVLWLICVSERSEGVEEYETMLAEIPRHPIKKEAHFAACQDRYMDSDAVNS